VSWGEILRKEREKLGYTLEKVEEETKIRKYYLEMMENDDFTSLPPQVYAIGFVKRYAKLLNLDENHMVSEFKLLAYGKEHHEDTVIVHTNPVNLKRKIPWRNVVYGVVFLMIVLWAGNYLAGIITDNGVKNNTPQIVDKQKEPAKPAEKTTENKPQGVKLEVKVIQNCWLNIIVDGVSQYTGIVPAGENRIYEGKKSVYINAGNAGGIEITFNGVKQSPLGASGQVVDKEFLADNQDSGQE